MPIKETAEAAAKAAEAVEGRLKFVQRFLNTKWGPEILFVVLVGAGVGFSWFFNDKGVARGKTEQKENYKFIISSFKRDSISREKEIFQLEGDLAFLRKKLDTCNQMSTTENMNREVLKRIDEMEKMKEQMRQKLYNDKKFNQNLNSLIGN